MAQSPDSLSRHKAWDTVLDWIDRHDLALTVGSIAFVVLSATAVFVTATLGGREPDATDSNLSLVEQEAVQGPVEYVNRAQGYGFIYPGTWDIQEAERFTRIQSPDGIVVSYRLGAAGDLDVGSSRLLESLADAHPDLELIGTRRERIDGARSLLVSGTATDEAGRSVRFLAITIRAEPRNYAISIFVPGQSDPARVLPRIEEIVSSFELR
jgi:hypothetical protein